MTPAPARPLSGFMYFASEMRPVVIKEHNLQPRQIGLIGRLLGKKWKELDAEGRKPYLARATADRDRYQREAAQYQKLLLERERARALKALRETRQAQRRMADAAASAAEQSQVQEFTPYMAYVQEMRPRLIMAHPNESPSQIGLRLGLGWDYLREKGLVKDNRIDTLCKSPLWSGPPSRYSKAGVFVVGDEK